MAFSHVFWGKPGETHGPHGHGITRGAGFSAGLNSWGEGWGVRGTFKVGLCDAWLRSGRME